MYYVKWIYMWVLRDIYDTSDICRICHGYIYKFPRQCMDINLLCWHWPNLVCDQRNGNKFPTSHMMNYI